MTSSPLLSFLSEPLPEGPILFLTTGSDAAPAVPGNRPVIVLDGDPDGWRLGYQRWAAIVSLFGDWTTAQRRRLFGRIPNALKPGGVFLLEAHAVGTGGPLDLDEGCLDPIDVRPELEILDLAHFATVPGPDGTAILQVAGIHREAEEDTPADPGSDLPLRAA